MRVAVFASSRKRWLSDYLLDYLRDTDEVVGVARTPEEYSRVLDVKAEIAVSVSFRAIIPVGVLGAFPRGVVNVHTGYLPYNRGVYPNVWSIVEGTPAGITIHYLDVGVDTGDILVQEREKVYPWDTGETLYRRLEDRASRAFRLVWPAIRDGNIERTSQDRTKGCTHYIRDVMTIDRVNLDTMYPARYLIDLLRARSFRGYDGAYFVRDGKRVYMRLELRTEDQDLE